jgi:hypothetical protein
MAIDCDIGHMDECCNFEASKSSIERTQNSIRKREREKSERCESRDLL